MPKKQPPQNTGFSSVSHQVSARDLIYGGPLAYEMYKPRTDEEFVEFEIEFDSEHEYEAIPGDTQELGFDCQMLEENPYMEVEDVTTKTPPNSLTEMTAGQRDLVEEYFAGFNTTKLQDFPNAQQSYKNSEHNYDI